MWKTPFSGPRGRWEFCRQLCTSQVSLRRSKAPPQGKLALRLEFAFLYSKEIRTQDARLMTAWKSKHESPQSSFKHWLTEEGYSYTCPAPTPILFPEMGALNFWVGSKDGPHFPKIRGQRQGWRQQKRDNQRNRSKKKSSQLRYLLSSRRKL